MELESGTQVFRFATRFMVRHQMTDRAEDLRREGTKCRVLARMETDPKARAKLVHMAAVFEDLANSASADFGLILKVLNDEIASRL
jgi:hypothetical protein